MPLIITTNPYDVLGDAGLVNYRGQFATPGDLMTAIPFAMGGDYAVVDSTGTIWKWQSGGWTDSGEIAFIQTERDQLADLVNNAEVIAGHVNIFADLPDVVVSVGQKWIVDNGTGVWGINRQPAGTYLSTGTIWTSKFNAVDVINALTSTQTQKALSANMGRIVNEDLQDHKNNNANPHDTILAQVLAADPDTDATTAEIEALTDSSNVDGLHEHARIKNASGTTLAHILVDAFRVTTNSVLRFSVDALGNLLLSSYLQNVRNDGTVADQKSLTTNNTGDVLLRKVLPYLAMLTNLTGGVNQLSVYATYMQLDFTITEDGQYPIDWFYVWSLNSAADDFLGQVVLDTNPPSAEQILVTHQQEPKDAGGAGIPLPNLNGGAPINTGTNQRNLASGFTVRTLTAGDYSLRIQIADEDGGNEAAIYQGNLRVGHRANV